MFDGMTIRTESFECIHAVVLSSALVMNLYYLWMCGIATALALAWSSSPKTLPVALGAEVYISCYLVGLIATVGAVFTKLGDGWPAHSHLPTVKTGRGNGTGFGVRSAFSSTLVRAVHCQLGSPARLKFLSTYFAGLLGSDISMPPSGRARSGATSPSSYFVWLYIKEAATIGAFYGGSSGTEEAS